MNRSSSLTRHRHGGFDFVCHLHPSCWRSALLIACNRSMRESIASALGHSRVSSEAQCEHSGDRIVLWAADDKAPWRNQPVITPVLRLRGVNGARRHLNQLTGPGNKIAGTISCLPPSERALIPEGSRGFAQSRGVIS